MGIQGLIPFLKRSSRLCTLSEFAGQTVAIDAYCWLHKGAFSCAEQLAKGIPTDGYVIYVMKQVNLLLSFGIKPILIFDGCNLSSKAVTEQKRRENREKNRRRAKELLREGKVKEARECFQRCVDITPLMAHKVIKACRERNIDTLVAPYEADAQLAFLSQSGIADVIITEDSDLILFGCEKIIFKLDNNGGGCLVEKDKLHLSMKVPPDKFTFDKFRNMCILSGCDYLPSLHGIGLVKACRFFVVTSNPDVFMALCKLPSNLKMPNINVTLEYREGFMRAMNTVLYQLVFDPVTLTLRPLNPYPSNLSHLDMPYCGDFFGHEKALQIALGNIDVQTGQVIDDFDPSSKLLVNKSGRETVSIWCPEKFFGWKAKKERENLAKLVEEERQASLVGKQRCVIFNLKKRKRTEETEDPAEGNLSDDYLASLYSHQLGKQPKINGDEDASESIERGTGRMEDSSKVDAVNSPSLQVGKESSPTFASRRNLTKSPATCRSDRGRVTLNPFTKKESLPSRRNKKCLSFRKLVRSKYFVASNNSSDHPENGKEPDILEDLYGKSECEKSPQDSISISPTDKRRSSGSNEIAVIDDAASVCTQDDKKADFKCSDVSPTVPHSAPSTELNSSELIPLKDSNSPKRGSYRNSTSTSLNIFETPPCSQNKENALVRFAACSTQSVAVGGSAHLQTPTATPLGHLSSFRFKAILSTAGKLQHNERGKNPRGSSSQTSCRVSGLRRTTTNKEKQLSLKDMFAFKKDKLTYRY